MDLFLMGSWQGSTTNGKHIGITWEYQWNMDIFLKWGTPTSFMFHSESYGLGTHYFLWSAPFFWGHILKIKPQRKNIMTIFSMSHLFVRFCSIFGNVFWLGFCSLKHRPVRLRSGVHHYSSWKKLTQDIH